MKFDFLTILMVLGVAASVGYRVSFLHNKRLSYLSLVQIFYLIVFPGIIFPVLINYLLSIVERPLNEATFFSDKILLPACLLSLFLGYGGLAIHSVTKMIYKTMVAQGLHKKKDNELVKMTQFFHLTFSHNLIFSSILFTAICGVLLEMNHVPGTDQVGLVRGIIKGGLLGVAMLLGLVNYNPAHDGYRGRWSDLKYVFMALWMALVLLLYGIKRTRPGLMEYDLLLPVLISFSMLFSLSVFLVYRKLRKEKIKPWWQRIIGWLGVRLE